MNGNTEAREVRSAQTCRSFGDCVPAGLRARLGVCLAGLWAPQRAAYARLLPAGVSALPGTRDRAQKGRLWRSHASTAWPRTLLSRGLAVHGRLDASA